MKGRIRAAAAQGGLYAGLLLGLWLLLAFSAMIPNEALRPNFERDAEYFSAVEPFQFHNGDRWNAIGDNYADVILLDLSWHMGEGENPFAAAIDTRYNDGGEQGENVGLRESVMEGTPANTDYTRYWHGSAMLVRLFHLFTDIRGMRLLGFLLAILLLGLNLAILIRKKHPDLALLLLVSLLAVQSWNIRLSLEYQTAYLIALSLLPLWLLLEKRGGGPLLLLSTATGLLTAFFDFLTTETLPILLPMILITAARAKENRLPPFKKALFGLLWMGLCWAVAYALTFLLKWTAATLVTGENAFALAFASAAERVGAAALGDEAAGFFSPIAANLTMLFGGTARVEPGRALLGSGITLLVLGSVWYLFRGKAPRKEALLLLIPGMLVFLRFLALNNHSYLHEFFTYRALASTALALLTALRLNIALPEKKGKRGRKG